MRGRRITFIPQDPYGSFNPLFTVGAQAMEVMKWKSPQRAARESRGIAGFFSRYPRARRRADAAAVSQMLRAVQIPDASAALAKLPHEFSGGQRQRLMIALALLPQPQLVIADEPTTALDVTIQAQILKLLKRLAKESGVSVLFTTHDLGTAYEICDRITVMYAGQEVETAPVDDFFRRPRHPYTVRLLESLPRPGRELARDRRRDSRADHPAGRMPLPPPLQPRDRRLPHGAPARHSARRRARGALLSPHRRGDPGMSGAPILSVDMLARHFPVRNCSAGRRAAVRALDGVSFEVRAGRDARHRRASRAAASPRSARRWWASTRSSGADRLRGQGHHRQSAARAPRGGAEAAVLLPGPGQLARPALDDRAAPWHEPLIVHTALTPSDRDARIAKIMQQVGLPLTHLDLYPARALGRPAAARRARTHPDAAPAPRHPGRADLRPRRVGAGLRAQAAARAAARLLPHLSVHLARPLRRAHDVRPRRRDVSRAGSSSWRRPRPYSRRPSTPIRSPCSRRSRTSAAAGSPTRSRSRASRPIPRGRRAAAGSGRGARAPPPSAPRPTRRCGRSRRHNRWPACSPDRPAPLQRHANGQARARP